jgi:hypothetical protein
MVSVLFSSVVYCEFESRAGKTKDYKIGICWEYISPFMNVAVDEYDYFAKQIQKVFPETCYSDYM